MDFFHSLDLCGGLAVFLYGMHMMGIGLEKISGGKLHQTLEKLTSNIFVAVVLGAVVAGVTHSSSATIVVVIGLVNANILKLNQAIAVILGANVGTTITSQILRLGDVNSSNFFLEICGLKGLAPICAVIGICLMMISSKTTTKNIGEIFVGFSVLFFGMLMMENSVINLRDEPWIGTIFATLSNPVLGILAGAVVSATLHSSAASVGILQALSATGQISYAAALPIVMGQNIGTCITPIMAGFGTSKNAKRASVIDLYFKLIGTVIFLIIVYSLKDKVIWLLEPSGNPRWLDAIDKGGIANFHTLFNLITAVILIPFIKFLERLAVFTIKSDGKSYELKTEHDILSLDDRLLLSPGLALGKCNDAVLVMANYARVGFKQTIGLIDSFDHKSVEQVRNLENMIDHMDDKLSNYLLKLSSSSLSEADNRKISDIFHHMSEFERINDHITNMANDFNNLHKNKIKLSDTALQELSIISSAVSEILDMAIDVFANNNVELGYNVEPLEQVVDAMKSTIKRRHIDRLKDALCTIDGGVIFIDMLSNLERISDHCSNIALYVIGRASHKEFNTHTYTTELHEGKWEDYNEKYNMYTQKYYSAL